MFLYPITNIFLKNIIIFFFLKKITNKTIFRKQNDFLNKIVYLNCFFLISNINSNFFKFFIPSNNIYWCYRTDKFVNNFNNFYKYKFFLTYYTIFTYSNVLFLKNYKIKNNTFNIKYLEQIKTLKMICKWKSFTLVNVFLKKNIKYQNEIFFLKFKFLFKCFYFFKKYSFKTIFFYNNNTFIEKINTKNITKELSFEGLPIEIKKYNNYSNYKLIQPRFKYNINHILNNLMSRNNNNFINYIFISDIEKIFKNKIYIKTLNNLSMSSFFKKNIFLNLKKYFFFFKKNFNSTNLDLFVEILSSSLFLKDLSIFVNYLIHNLEKTNIKNHKKFLLFLKNFFNENSEIIFNKYQIDGISFDIRGKVGVAGNSKKRHFFFCVGKINLSKKMSKLDYQQNIVKTSTGCLGLTMIMSYK